MDTLYSANKNRLTPSYTRKLWAMLGATSQNIVHTQERGSLLSKQLTLVISLFFFSPSLCKTLRIVAQAIDAATRSSPSRCWSQATSHEIPDGRSVTEVFFFSFGFPHDNRHSIIPLCSSFTNLDFSVVLSRQHSITSWGSKLTQHLIGYMEGGKFLNALRPLVSHGLIEGKQTSNINCVVLLNVFKIRFNVITCKGD
jgi:hypothetical protein